MRVGRVGAGDAELQGGQSLGELVNALLEPFEPIIVGAHRGALRERYIGKFRQVCPEFGEWADGSPGSARRPRAAATPVRVPPGGRGAGKSGRCRDTRSAGGFGSRGQAFSAAVESGDVGARRLPPSVR